MAKAAPATRPATSVQAPLRRTLREAALWMFGALALAMLVALATYHPADPGFTQAAADGAVRNRAGAVGAWFASVAYMLFGGPAYLFPVLTLFAGWLIFRERRSPAPLDKLEFLLRFAGFLLTLVTSCALATLHFAARELPETAGGIVGQIAGESLREVLGLLVASIVLLCLWIASVSVFGGFSWLAVMDRIGQGVLGVLSWFRGRYDALRDRAAGRRAQQARQETVKAEQRRTTGRSKPRIEPSFSAVERSQRVEKERQVPLFDPPAASELPPLSLLNDPPPKESGYSEESLEAMSRLVELKLKDFGIDVEVVSVQPGPVVTRFELDPAPGVKSAQISNLAKDLARSLSVISVRVVEVIPGKSYVGLEIPNEHRELVTLGEILQSKAYDELASPLTLALGKDIAGQSMVADLARMPHLMIAGTTGSGKSVALNAMVLSLLYKAHAEHVRLIMIDPKMLELSVYEGIPHLLTPVVTDMKEAANALRWCVAEMERRYQLMASLGVRNIGGYNRKVKDAVVAGKPLTDPTWEPPEVYDEEDPPEAPELESLPFVVVIIDELADMMMIVGKKVEELIARLAQKARASGIHMIVATQRPSVDVITGLIKANIPARIAFQVSAKVDSRTILDQQGAENLLGHGDMLFLPPGVAMPVRVHGAFVGDNEVHTVVHHLRESGEPRYLDEILSGPSSPIPGLPDAIAGGADGDSEQDPLYDQAVRVVTETRKASISGVQRRLKIGYNRAARMVEAMEEAGLVGPLQPNGSREVLAPPPPEE